MSQDKEEYEVGIPLDDLAFDASSSDPDAEETDETDETDAASGDEEHPSGAEEETGVGLPSLFDEEELAEVGLKASPFDGGEDVPQPEKLDSDRFDEAPEAQPAEAVFDTDDPASLPEELSETAGLEDNGPVSEDLYADEIALEGPMIPAEPEVTGEAALDQPPENLASRLDAIQDQLLQLNDEFAGKLKYDAHKDQIIDKLHQELQEYKQDIVKKHILSIVLDVVKVADDIRKWITYFRSLDVSQRDPVKLFRYLEAIPSDLEDIFYWQGVKPYVNREGDFDPATQRAIKKIPTDDISKDKTIAKSIRPGYEWEGKVIRQEMVAVYVFEDGSHPSLDTRNIDE